MLEEKLVRAMEGEQQLGEESRQGVVEYTPARDMEPGSQAQPQPLVEDSFTRRHFCPSVHDVQL